MEKKETFSVWCDILFDEKDKNQIRYIRQEVRAIKSEAIKVLERLNAYQAYRNDENKYAIEKLIEGCDAFCRVVDKNGKYTGEYVCHSDKLVKAVINLFPIELSENKYIKIGYAEKFNSDDFCD